MAKILHVEDDPRNRLLVRKLLEAVGHEIADVTTGLDAVRVASEWRPDLILLDVNIPGLDGYEVTLRLRGIASLRDVPIVITAEGERRTSLAVGADAFVTKPIDATEFKRLIERVLRGHRDRTGEMDVHRLRERSQIIVERLERKVHELSESNARLQEMARLRREFLRNVSHELATPLTPVVGYLQLLREERMGPLSEGQTKALDAVHGSIQRFRSVVDTLIDVSALETGTMRFLFHECDFREVVQVALRELQGSAAQRRLSLDMADYPLPVQADRDKLRRAMVHILDNAYKFSGEGGEIAVRVSRATLPGGIPCAEFAVADSGPGIGAELRERIFEPFFQADGSVTRQYGGVGLGLAFAQRVVEAHEGQIVVESPPPLPIAGRSLRGSLVRLRIAAIAA